MLQSLWQDETGAGMVEYAVLTALVCMAIFVLVRTFGDKIKAIFTQANTQLDEAQSVMGQ